MAPQSDQVPEDDHRYANPPVGRRIATVTILLLVVIGAGWIALSLRQPGQSGPEPLVASGTLEADEVLIGSEVLGRILSVAEEGDPVQADGPVAQLDDSLIQLQLHQAQLAARQQLEIQAERYRLRSPISGVVTRSPLHVGETVSPGQTVLAVADLSRLRLTVYVLQQDLGRVRVGQAVTVTVDPFPDRPFAGVVTGTNPQAEFTPRNVQTPADRLNLVFGVKIRVDNPDQLLKPGMPADAHFPPVDMRGSP